MSELTMAYLIVHPIAGFTNWIVLKTGEVGPGHSIARSLLYKKLQTAMHKIEGKLAAN